MRWFLKVPRDKTRKLAGEDLRAWVRVEVMKFTVTVVLQCSLQSLANRV